MRLVLLITVLSSLVFPLYIRVGVPDDYPVAYVENGEFKGFYIDVFNEIARRRDWEVDYVNDRWVNLLQMLKDGRINALMAIAQTPEREKVFDFNEEAFLSNWGVVVSRVKVEKITDLKGLRVGLVRKDVYSQAFMKIAEGFHLDFVPVWFDHYEEVLKALDGGEVQAGVVSRIASIAHKGEYSYQETPVIFSPVDLKMAFTKGSEINSILIPAIDDELRRMKADKGSIYWKAFKRYISGEKEKREYFWILSAILLALLIFSVYMFRAVKARRTELEKVEGLLRDMSDKYSSAEREIRRLDERLNTTSRNLGRMIDIVSRVTSFETSDEEFFRAVLNLALELIPKAKYGTISFLEGDKWKFVAAVGHDIGILKSLDLKRDQALVDLKGPVVVDDIMEKNRRSMPSDLYEKLEEATRPIKSTLIVPIKYSGRIVGFFSLDIPEGSWDRFEEEDVKLAEKFSRMISAFYAARRYRELEEETVKNVVLGLVRMIESLTPVERGRAERVAEISSMIAEEMKLGPDAEMRIYYTALLSIALEAVPGAVENSMKRVKGVEDLMELASMVVSCKNGCEEAPLEVKIVTLARTFERIATVKGARSALEELKGRFDDGILKILEDLVRKGEISL